VAQLARHPAWQENAGAITRLYLGGLGRLPTTAGLGPWVARAWSGTTLQQMAPSFVAPWASLSNDEFVAKLYEQGLGTAVSAGRRARWVAALDDGVRRSDILVLFTGSPGVRQHLATDVRVVSTWFGLLRRAPTRAEISAHQARSQAALVDHLRTSFTYASRFTA
jgi:hypothetical protein